MTSTASFRSNTKLTPRATQSLQPSICPSTSAFSTSCGLKRVEQALSTSWRRASELCHIGTHNVLSKGKDRAQHKLLQKFALSVAYTACKMGIHQQMMHFVSNLEYYIMFEVLECSWERFSEEMRAARDVDALIAAHNRYVDGILERTLLSQQSEGEKAQIDAVFRCILDYASTQQTLTELAARQLQRHGVLSRQRDGREADEEWSIPQEEEEEIGEDDKAHPAAVMLDHMHGNRYMRIVDQKGLGDKGEMQWLIKDLHEKLK